MSHMITSTTDIKRTRRPRNIVDILNNEKNMPNLLRNSFQSSVIDVDALYPTDEPISEIKANSPPWTNRNPEELLETKKGFRPFKISDRVSVCKVVTSTAEVKCDSTSSGDVEAFVIVGDNKMTPKDILDISQYTLRHKP